MDSHQEELVQQAVGGDRVAIQRLLTRHHERLVAAICERMPADLQGALAAEDICQEAYVSVFQQVGTLREATAATFRGWLHAIAERKLIDAIRAERTAKRGGGRRATANGEAVSSVIDLLGMVAVHEQTPSRSAARGELIAGVQSALENLGTDYRDALRLHYIEGLTVAETAERMGRSSGAVVMLCNRALKRLGEQIGDPARFLSRDA